MVPMWCSQVLDMVMALFAASPGSGELDVGLFLDVLRRREFLGAVMRRAAVRFVEPFSGFWSSALLLSQVEVLG